MMELWLLFCLLVALLVREGLRVYLLGRPPPRPLAPDEDPTQWFRPSERTLPDSEDPPGIYRTTSWPSESATGPSSSATKD